MGRAARDAAPPDAVWSRRRTLPPARRGHSSVDARKTRRRTVRRTADGSDNTAPCIPLCAPTMLDPYLSEHAAELAEPRAPSAPPGRHPGSDVVPDAAYLSGRRYRLRMSTFARCLEVEDAVRNWLPSDASDGLYECRFARWATRNLEESAIRTPGWCRPASKCSADIRVKSATFSVSSTDSSTIAAAKTSGSGLPANLSPRTVLACMPAACSASAWTAEYISSSNSLNASRRPRFRAGEARCEPQPHRGTRRANFSPRRRPRCAERR